MPHLKSLCLVLGLAALLQACQLAGPGTGKGNSQTDEVTANAVAGDAIEVTALDDPAAATDETAPAAPGPEAAPEAEPQGDPPAPSTEAESEEPAAEADPAPVEEPEPAEEVPEAKKSEQQLACEKKKGRWVRDGTGSLRTCVFTTKDSGKTCTRKSQCDGECLARSGTCSPFKPLLGCNEVLQDNGARVTLCLE